MSDTVEKWKQRVADWRASGQTAATFSTGRPWSARSLRWWSSRLGRESTTAAKSALAPVVRVVPLVRGRAVASEAAQRGSIVVEALDAQVRITLDADAPLTTIAAVLSVLLPKERR